MRREDREGIPWTKLWPGMAVMFLAEFAHGGAVLVLLTEHGRETLSMSWDQVGLCLSLYYAAELLLKAPAGAIVYRLGQRAVLSFSICASAVTLGLMPFMKTPASFMVVVVLHGASASAILPGLLVFAADRAREKERGAALGAIFTAWLAGLGAGALTCMLLRDVTTSHRFMILLCAWLPALVVSLCMLPGARRREPRKGGTVAEALQTGRDVAKRLARTPLLVAGSYLQNFSVGLLVPVFADYCRTVHELTQTQTAILAVGGGGLALALMIPMGRLSDALGRKHVLITSLATAALMVAAFPLIGSFAGLVVLVGVAGASYALILPTWNAVLLGHAPRDKRVLLLSAFMAIEQCGIASGPVVSGRLLQRLGPRAPFLIAGVILASMALLYTFADRTFRVAPDAADAEDDG